MQNLLLSRFLLLPLAGLLVWGLVPADGGAQPGLDLSATAVPVFFQPAGVLVVPPAAPPAAVLGLPSSIMPHTNPGCSVDQASTPSECSIVVSPPNRCTAHCDSSMRCSAITGPPGSTGDVACSVLGEDNRACSVLQAPVGPSGPSWCSALSADPAATVSCSIMDIGDNQKCSSQNIPGPADICSAQAVPGSTAHCSVINGGTADRNYCTTKFPGTKRCSTLTAATECSIFVGNRGRCTNFTGASGACSAGASGSFCSVVPTSPGTFCNIP